MDFKDLMDFSGGKIYFIFGLSRVKNNRDITKAQRVFLRYPVRSMESYEFALENLKTLCERTGLKMYLYVSVNARNTAKANEEFDILKAKYAAEALNGKPENLHKLYPRQDKVWYSVCMKPICRGTKYFLLDIDTKDYDTRLQICKIIYPVSEILADAETHNGYHWVVKPFDIRLIENIENVTVKKDGLLYLGCTGFTEEM
jgi:hypothetical protein